MLIIDILFDLLIIYALVTGAAAIFYLFFIWDC